MPSSELWISVPHNDAMMTLDESLTWIQQRSEQGVLVAACRFPLFPLDSGGGFGRDVIGDAVDAGDFGHDAA